MISFLITLTQAYTPSEAKVFAYIADIAYSKAADIQAWNCSLCGNVKLTDIKVFENTTADIQSFVGYNPSSKSFVVAFRGSVDTKNWIQNLKISLVPYSGCANCMIHSGFLQSYNMVDAFVQNSLKILTAKYGVQSVHVTGHSLGGALSMICAVQVSKSFKLGHVYTFGQPRVGNGQLASFMDSKIPTKFRLIHFHDIVPHLPPSPVYLHSSGQIWYVQDMTSYKVCSGGEDATCADSVPVTSYSTSDHSMDLYLKLKAVEAIQ